MDYGSHLKQSVGNLSRASKSYAKQSKLDGSVRQIRGRVIRLLSHRACTPAELSAEVPDQRLPRVLADLRHEGLIQFNQQRYNLFGTN